MRYNSDFAFAFKEVLSVRNGKEERNLGKWKLGKRGNEIRKCELQALWLVVTIDAR